MQHIHRTALGLGLGLITASAALLQAAPNLQEDPSEQRAAQATAFVGARLIPISGPEIEDGVIVVADGKIQAIGAREDVELGSDIAIEDVAGKVILPGLICTHSHVGGPWGADESGPIQPEVRSLDSIDVRSATLRKARAGGLTTINAMPGSGHLMSGQTVYLKLRNAGTIEELTYLFDDGSPMGGMKMANGTNSQRDAPFPGTRAKSAALVREVFVKAVAYRDKLNAGGDDAPERDLGMEALVEVLDGKRVVHHHTHRHDDIVTVLRLADEFGFRVVLHHVSEGWKVADEIAAAGAPCSVIVIDSPGGKEEAKDLSFDTARILDEAGVGVSIHTDDYITDSRLFLRSAALAVRAGFDRDKALAALTLEGARQLDLDARVGSLEVGKDADLCILDGDPFSVYTQVLETWVEGQRVFDLDDPEDRLFARGGRGAGESRVFTECCANVRGGR